MLCCSINLGNTLILPPFLCKALAVGKQISNLDKQNCFYFNSIDDMKTLFYFHVAYFDHYCCFVYLESVRYI
jgi:hypothetical protein